MYAAINEIKSFENLKINQSLKLKFLIAVIWKKKQSFASSFSLFGKKIVYISKSERWDFELSYIIFGEDNLTTLWTHQIDIFFQSSQPRINPFFHANLLNCTIARATPSERNFNRSLIHAPRPSHRFLASFFFFFISLPLRQTSTNFSSTRRRQRAEIIIGAGRADYSQTMRTAGPINGFLNDYCPGECPVYIRRGGLLSAVAAAAAAAIAAPTASRNLR